MSAFERLHTRARPLRRAVAACVAVDALSPIDLIPDVIPVLGSMDDLVLCHWGCGWPSG